MIETRVVVLIMCCAVLYPCLSLGLGVESIVLAEYVYIYIPPALRRDFWCLVGYFWYRLFVCSVFCRACCVFVAGWII